MELDKIYNMDCLEGMKQIPDGSVDAIICDLPYGTTANAWDIVIPFDKLWEQYKRIIKRGAPIVMFGSEPFSTMLRMSNLSWYKYDWIWKKSRCADFIHANHRPLKIHEIVSVFCEKAAPYHPQGLKPCHNVRSNNANKHGRVHRDWNHEDKYVAEFENYPTTMLEFGNDLDSFHPTQKPVDLLRYLVRTYSNEGDTILDNCMGSGTTAVACIKEKRHFIGFELNKDYYDKACRRIDAEKRQLTLF